MGIDRADADDPGRALPAASPLTYEPVRRLSLDGFRGLALALNVAVHVRGTFMPLSPVGIDMFFTLSGFLITTLLLTPERPITVGTTLAFWAGRVRRLIPALVVMALGSALLAVVAGAALLAREWQLTLVTATLYVQNIVVSFSGPGWPEGLPDPFGHLWSLGVEEHFYLLWPIVLAAMIGWLGLSRRWTAVVWVGLAGATVSFVAMALGAAGWSTVAGYHFTPFRVGGMLLGAAVAGLVGSGRLTRVPWWGKAVCWAVLGVGVVQMRWADGVYYFGGAAAVSAASALLVAAFWVERDSWSARAMSLWPLPLLGRISYAAYLWHLPMLVLVPALLLHYTGWVPNLWVIAALGLGATLGAAGLSFVLVERPVRTSRWLRERVAPWKQIVVGVSATVVTAVLVGWIMSPSGLAGALNIRTEAWVLGGTTGYSPGVLTPEGAPAGGAVNGTGMASVPAVPAMPAMPASSPAAG